MVLIVADRNSQSVSFTSHVMVMDDPLTWVFAQPVSIERLDCSRPRCFALISIQLNDLWDYTPDEKLAKLVFIGLDVRPHSGSWANPSRLCGRCHNLPLWSPVCGFQYSRAELAESVGQGCGLCTLLLGGLEGRVGDQDKRHIRFIRSGSYLTLESDRKKPVINLYRLPGKFFKR